MSGHSRDEAEVEGEAGEADAVVAVEDGLRGFSADEILVVGGAAEDGGLEVSLHHFGLPVMRIPESVPVREREADSARPCVVSLAGEAGRRRLSRSRPSISFCLRCPS